MIPVASTLVSETVRARERGRAVVLLESFWAVGWIVSAIIAYFVIPHYGWRLAFVIGALPAIYALYLRRTIQDPPSYTSQQKRKLSFADRVALVWSIRYRKATVMLWILWFTVVFSYYGMFLWLPSVMVLKGFGLVKSFQYVLIMTLAQLPGYFTAAYFIERFGRKFVLVTYLLLTAVSAIWFGNAQTAFWLTAAGVCLSFFNLGAWGAMYAYTPELYPTAVRSTAVGFTAACGRVGGVIGPYLVGLLVQRHYPMNKIFIVFFTAVVIGALAVLFMGKETRGTDPEYCS